MILSSTLEILEECLPMEATAVMKFKEGAVNTNDAVLCGEYSPLSQYLIVFTSTPISLAISFFVRPFPLVFIR